MNASIISFKENQILIINTSIISSNFTSILYCCNWYNRFLLFNNINLSKKLID